MRSIRTAGPADIDALVLLINQSYSVEAWFLDGERTHAAEVAELLTNSCFLVLEEDGALAGCVHVKLGERGYFGMLAVDAGRQGGGRGSMLIDAVEALCRQRGCRDLDICVLSLRYELPAFYEKRGFRRVGAEPFLVDGRTREPCELLHYTKSLEASAP